VVENTQKDGHWVWPSDAMVLQALGSSGESLVEMFYGDRAWSITITLVERI